MRPSPRPSVPSDLARRLAEAHAVLESSHDGGLPLAQRRRVRRLFGPPLFGLRRRAHVDNLVYRRQISLRAQAAGEAARLAAVEVDLDDYDGEPPDIDDDDLDPDAWEPEYVASIAAAGYPEADAEARREFWRWYLDVAVPEAWAAA